MYGMGEKKKSPWIHLHGHVHMGKDYLMYLKYLEEINKQSQLEGIKVRSYNVGIMCPWMDYQPRTLEQIMQRFDKYHFKKDD